MHVAGRCARQSGHSICIRLKFQQIALVARIAFWPSAIEQATQLDNVLINYTTEWVSDPHFVVFFLLLLLLWLGKKEVGERTMPEQTDVSPQERVQMEACQRFDGHREKAETTPLHSFTLACMERSKTFNVLCLTK